MNFIREILAELKEKNLYRILKRVNFSTASKIFIDDKEFINFSSNDYLGLSTREELKTAAKSAIEKYGIGAKASRLISGNFDITEELEKRIADFKREESAIVFPTGYQANVGTITSIVDVGDAVVIDKLCHASIIDGCKQSGARIFVFEHRNIISLEKVLNRTRSYRRKLVITDSVFSMDGDITPIPEILDVVKKYNAILMVDDAHGTGVLGKDGRGATEYFGIEGKIDILMGTLSKAVGCLGGFVCGRKELTDFLRNKARAFIYTTGIPPAICSAAIRAFEIIEKEPELRGKLWENINYLKKNLKSLGFDTGNSETQIIPLIIGDVEKTLKLSEYLFENGVFIPAIRPPTVPKDQCRLRISLSAIHTKRDIDVLIDVLKKC